MRRTGRCDGATGRTYVAARAEGAVTHYAQNLDRQAWIDRVHLYGGHSDPVVHDVHLPTVARTL